VQQRRVLGAALVKGDRSPVTIADFGSQALICRRLAERAPADAVMGEEDAAELRDASHAGVADAVQTEVVVERPGASREEVLAWIDRARSDGGRGRFWTLDPIDGTKGFLRGEQYAIALALIEGGAVVVGALACPNLQWRGSRGWIVVATRGGGCEAEPLEGGARQRVRVSEETQARSARMLESVEAAHGDLGGNAAIRAALGVEPPELRLDSQAKYALLALGEGEVYLRLPSSPTWRENVWDHAAGALVVEEAGGRVTDVEGRPLDFTTGRKLEQNRGVMATNGRVHDAFLGAVRASRSGGA
jgi:3'(2'), 5'-bisphosphate nucleotidase